MPKKRKSKYPPGAYDNIPIELASQCTDIPIMTPGDSEMLAVFKDGHIESIPYNYDGVKSVAAGLRGLERGESHHGKVVRLICNEGVREDYKSHIKG